MIDASKDNKLYSVEFIATDKNVIQTSGTREVKVYARVSEGNPYVKVSTIKSGDALSTLRIEQGLQVKLTSGKPFSYDKVGGVPAKVLVSKEELEEAYSELSSKLEEVELSLTDKISEQVAKVVDDAPEAFDTLKEMADWAQNHSTDVLDMQKKINDNITNISKVEDKVNALEIPSVEGLASEEWVESKNYALKQELESLASEDSVLSVSEKTDSNTIFLKKLVSELSGRVALLEATGNTSESQVVASKASDIAAVSTPLQTSLVVSSKDAMESMTSITNVYKNIAVVGADTEKSVNLKATDSIVIEGAFINGEKNQGNGKINFSTPEITIKNTIINGGTTAYNVFEGEQSVAENARNTKAFSMDNVTVETPTLTHNVANVYTPTKDAIINIKNSYFNLNVAKSNILRMSNYLNSDNVVINFENIDWTYENAPYSDSDLEWAGLIIYQPAGKDVALTGDLSHLKTWKINITNCRYNGVKITEANYGKINSIGYVYNLGGNGISEDISKYITIDIK